MQEQRTLTLTKKELKRFGRVFKDLTILDISDIDILIINSIKKKLKTSYFNLKKSFQTSIVIYFEKEEYRVLKILAMQYINLKKQSNQQADYSEYKNEFDEYLNNN
jgi:hypothetical protein